MKYEVKNILILRKILLLDFLMGGITGMAGLLFSEVLTHVLGLKVNLILVVSAITLLYAIVAYTLARQLNIMISLLRILIYANWFWTVVSIVLLYFHFEKATVLGRVFLILQIGVVGALAYWEGKQLTKK